MHAPTPLLDSQTLASGEYGLGATSLMRWPEQDTNSIDGGCIFAPI